MIIKKIFKITEIIESHNLSEVFIYQCIEKEWIVPSDMKNTYFDQEDISRILLIKDLKEDFGVNDESVPLILYLIDQMHWLKSQVKHLMENLKQDDDGDEYDVKSDNED